MEAKAKDFCAVRELLRKGEASCQDLALQARAQAEAAQETRAFISLRCQDEIAARAREIDLKWRACGRNPEKMPLYGLTFAVKDNIDVANIPTTAGCPDYAYTPQASAPVVEKLEAAGAVAIGKTNMDQFATGLTGCRSPYGTPVNPVNPDFAPGGSSSGSAVAVASGLVSFALGTDTAGSGRIPAALNNIVGLKPTRGLLSGRGVVPACRTLDCVSVFGLNISDSLEVLKTASGFDPQDPFSRTAPGAPVAQELKTFGIFASLGLSKEQGFVAAYLKTLSQLDGFGLTRQEVDSAPFDEAKAMLYEGPFLAERWAALGEFASVNPASLLPLTLSILQGGKDIPASQAFKSMYRLEALKREVAGVFSRLDFLLVPSLPRVFSLSEVAADPLGSNAVLGSFTNFVNLLDLCAISLPAGITAQGYPFGVTLIAPAWREESLAGYAARLHEALALTVGGTDCPVAKAAQAGMVKIAVAGAHLSDQPLNWQLQELGARFVRKVSSAPYYKLFALENFPPLRPGMVRVGEGCGAAIELEVWELPPAGAGNFLSRVLPPLAIGNVVLEDGEVVKGFICEEYAVAKEREISSFGGWRAWLASR